MDLAKLDLDMLKNVIVALFVDEICIALELIGDN